MTLLTAHKILISSAIVLFLFYAALEFRRYTNGDPAGLLHAIISVVAAGGFGVYLRRVWVTKSRDTSAP